MSYNHNLYNNFRGNYTFQNFALPRVPPPPPPPAFFIPPAPWSVEDSDRNFLKRFEANLQPIQHKIRSTKISISEIREDICNMADISNTLKQQQNLLEENMVKFSDEKWTSVLNQIEVNKTKVIALQAKLNDTCMETLRKLLSKRAAKRLRLKRLRLERKRQKEEWIKECTEKSRKIDENLQKIKDDIAKAKQEEQAKLEADIILKEVLRKKHDAKKCIVKLDALLKLRKARQNTARGRGDNVSEADEAAFNINIEKLKTLWTQKLTAYEKEEVELRNKLSQANKQEPTSNEVEREVSSNLTAWREVLFGAESPQVDFGGDMGRFVAARSQWDHFLSSKGTPIPVAWVPPAKYYQD